MPLCQVPDTYVLVYWRQKITEPNSMWARLCYSCYMLNQENLKNEALFFLRGTGVTDEKL